MADEPERTWFTQPSGLFRVVPWVVVTVVSVIVSKFVETYMVLSLIVALFVWLVWLASVERKRRRSPLAQDETPPPPKALAPPVWHPRPPLCDRDTEVRTAAQLVRDNGIVVIHGPRDVGTSAVGHAVAQRLIDHHDAEIRTTTRFDLRSRSASEPDDAVTTAGRVVSPFGIDEPADDTDEVLARVARELVAKLAKSGGILFLDNVTAPDQVRWLVREWPPDGPRLIVVGETALAELGTRGAVEIGPMALADLRELWERERTGVIGPTTWPAKGFSKVKKKILRQDRDEEVDELLRACFGRPGAVKAFAHEIDRPGSQVTLAALLADLRADGLVEGPIERVWRAILANLREGLSPDAQRLLSALAELPVTGLIKGAVAAMLGVSDPVALEELRIRNLVEEVDGRYRLPQEIRRAIEGTTKEEERQAVALDAVPALVRYYREFADLWAARLNVDPDGAEAWFRVSEPSFRPLYGNSYLDDELLALVLDDLCALADALDHWYVRQRLSSAMLAVNAGLYGLVDRAHRPELAALAALRVAAAHRMARRYGAAATQLDLARTHVETLPDGRVRSELDSREQVARALLALERESGFDEAYDQLTPADSPAVLLNLAALCLASGKSDEARRHLSHADVLAQEAGDSGAQAHSQELLGIYLAERDLVKAVRAWQLARAAFERIGEDQGEARCLVHLGATALVDPVAAGQLSRGTPEPLSPRAAAAVALEHLTRAKALRYWHPEIPFFDLHLTLARTRLNSGEGGQ